MSEKNSRLPRLINQNWKILKTETERINKLLTHIAMNHSELNEIIYTGAKLDYEKIGILVKNTNKKSKRGWKIRLDPQKKSTATSNNDNTEK